jgi:hypothetical protein
VQWQQAASSSDGPWTNVSGPGARTRTLTIAAVNVDGATMYRAVFLSWLAAGTPDQYPSFAITDAARLTLAG